MINTMLGYINLEFLNPIIDFLNAWYIPIITVLATAGVLYAIILGINLAKSDNADKRNAAKKRIVHASLSIVIVIALTFSLKFVLANLDDWVNHSAYNQITDTQVVTQMQTKFGTDQPITQLKGWDSANNTLTEGTSFVFKDIAKNDTKLTIVITVSDKKYSVTNGTPSDSAGMTYTYEIDLKTENTKNDTYRVGEERITIMNGNLTVGYSNVIWVQNVK